MTALRAIATTARTITIMVDADSALYQLPAPLQWSLSGGLQSGTTDTVPVFIEGLEPDTDYSFDAGDATLRFRTLPCAGCVLATDYGVSVDSADNAAAFARAINAVLPGGTLLVPPGCYRSGPIFLKSAMTLYLPEGARIEALHDYSGWPILQPYDGPGGPNVGTWEGLPDACFAAPLTAINCSDLLLTGRGVLDAGGDRGDWWQWPKDTRRGARRPRAVFLACCARVTLSGLTIRNAPSWTVHPFRSVDVLAAALQIENPADSPNTDGFNPESCSHVAICGTRISVGDDCIAVKSGKRGTGRDTRIAHVAPTRHLTIENCLMQDGHGAVVIGSEMSGGVSDVMIRRCEFRGTDRGLRIKTRRGRGGAVARITLQDVTMDRVGTALAVNAYYYCDADGKSHEVQSRWPALVDAGTPQISDIHMARVTLTGVRHAVAAILGLPESPVTDVYLSDISVSYDPGATSGETLMACFLTPRRHGGILRRFARVETDAALRPLVQDFGDAG